MSHIGRTKRSEDTGSITVYSSTPRVNDSRKVTDYDDNERENNKVSRV